MEYITGVHREQIILMPECVEDYIEAENPVRVIDAYVQSVDLIKLGFKKAKPNETGRPSYAPSDLLKLYIYGYLNRIRSSRRLEAETHRNLEVIWLMCKLRPDYRSIARFRHDNAKALKNVFKDFVKLCLKLGLYGKELVAIDGSKFRAVNSNDRNFNEAKLNDRIKRLDSRIEEYMSQLEETDHQESSESAMNAEEIRTVVKGLEARKTIYESYLTELDENGQTQKSLTDPDARRMVSQAGSHVCYNAQTAVDSKHKLIAEFDVTNNGEDTGMLSSMATASAQMLETDDLMATADKGFNSATGIAECLMNGITPQVAGTDFDICIPIENPAEGEHSTEELHAITEHSNGRCVYLRDRNVAVCPMGHTLYPSKYKKKRRIAIFTNRSACAGCQCKCTKSSSKEFEIVVKHEDYDKPPNDKDLRVRQTRVKANTAITRRRKEIVEHPFGTIKRSMDGGYLLMRGLEFVTCEFALMFFAYNLKRVINILGVNRLIEAISTRYNQQAQ